MDVDRNQASGTRTYARQNQQCHEVHPKKYPIVGAVSVSITAGVCSRCDEKCVHHAQVLVSQEVTYSQHSTTQHSTSSINQNKCEQVKSASEALLSQFIPSLHPSIPAPMPLYSQCVTISPEKSAAKNRTTSLPLNNGSVSLNWPTAKYCRYSSGELSPYGV